MNIGRFCFTPPWWAWIAMAAAVAILSALGIWQIERAHYKERLAAAQIAAQQAGPGVLHIARAAAKGNARNAELTYGRQYRATGHFDAAHQVLMDNQVNGTQVGFRVWTPLILENGIRIMVDRGWVPMPEAGRQHLPDPSAPAGQLTVSGFWRTFPQPGIRTRSAAECAARPWPRALNFPNAATVRCQYGAPVANGLLLLNPAASYGFVRDWDGDQIVVSPLRHYIYASQWFLMAVICFGIFLFVNTRKRQ
jgi:surfeit locus 1 family protein